jgi:hypothetical protein
MIRQSFECESGHQSERMVKGGTEHIRCPQCRKRAEILWQADRSYHSHLQEAVVIFKMPDGSYSFPGTNRARTPAGAERMELRKAGEVRKVMREHNRREAALESHKEQRYLEVAERQQSERRAKLTHLMGQENDPVAKDLYREALNRAHLEPSSGYREAYWEAGE